MLTSANVIVFNYLYLLDPVISETFIKQVAEGAVVVFDEAHNIDDVCIECYTVRINKGLLANARKEVEAIGDKARALENQQQEQMEAEYERMLAELRRSHGLKEAPRPEARPLRSK